MIPILEIKNLNKQFGGIIVADNISFKLNKGTVLGLIGPNGAGKTSLFNLISGVNNQDSGSIYISGHKANTLPIYRRARLGLARTWQDIRLFPSLNLIDNLIISTRSYAAENFLEIFRSTALKTRENKEIEEQALSLIHRVGLGEMAFLLPPELSYGQQKLLGLARALMNNGDCMLLDEPMAGVEGRTYEQIKMIIKEELDNNKAILVVEHNIGFIKEICTQAFFMVNGRIISQGSVDDLTSDKKLTKIYFGG
jgi:branched-chain amino acid transport system ATP-binding protein